jgi:hypothetical protein
LGPSGKFQVDGKGGGIGGLADMGSLCTENSAALIVNGIPGDSKYVAAIIAHEMGIFIFERSKSSNQNYNY